MDKLIGGLCVLLLLSVGADIYTTTSYYYKCKDAGGVAVTSSVCINPTAVIEVD